MTLPEQWTSAQEADLGEILAGLRHRLANAAAPLGVLVEMLDDDIDDEMAGAAKRSVARLERVLVLMSVLAGRSISTGRARPGVSLRRATDGMPAELEPLAEIMIAELAPDAANAGATAATLSYADGELYWHDNGTGFPDGVLVHLGSRQPGGLHGCGLGLAAVCSVARSVGATVSATNAGGAHLRATLN